jgi:Integrase zinc binding domain
VVTDALSRLDTGMSHSTCNSNAFPELFENLDGKSLTIDYPLSTEVIAEHQRKDTTLVQHIKRPLEYFTKQMDGHEITLLNNKIYIPRTLRKEILKWYHTALHHPLIIRTEKSIPSHFTWPDMRTDIEEHKKMSHLSIM